MDLTAHPILMATIRILIVFAVLSGLVAYLVYLERKVLAFMQVRLGPMRVGPYGLLQPIADGLKLMLKEDIVPSQADRFVFMIAPIITLIPAFIVFSVIPFGAQSAIHIPAFTVPVTGWHFSGTTTGLFITDL